MYQRRDELSYDDFADFKDRLTAAFKAIRKHKIAARQNFSCCGGCASYELGEFVRDRPKYAGAVYYHRQDTQNMGDGSVYLGYGSRPDLADEDLATQRIGELIAEEIRAAGLEVDWDGKASSRIMVRYPNPEPSQVE